MIAPGRRRMVLRQVRNKFHTRHRMFVKQRQRELQEVRASVDSYLRNENSRLGQKVYEVYDG